jgi:hypothetical protein
MDLIPKPTAKQKAAAQGICVLAAFTAIILVTHKPIEASGIANQQPRPIKAREIISKIVLLFFLFSAIPSSMMVIICMQQMPSKRIKPVFKIKIMKLVIGKEVDLKFAKAYGLLRKVTVAKLANNNMRKIGLRLLMKVFHSHKGLLLIVSLSVDMSAIIDFLAKLSRKIVTRYGHFYADLVISIALVEFEQAFYR